MYYKEIFMSKKLNSIKSILLILALVFALSLIGCTPTDGGDSDSGISDTDTEVRPVITLLRISGPRNVSLEKGDELSLIIDHPAEVLKYVEWSVEGDSVTVDQNGKITAVAVGTCKVVATYGALSDRITVTVTESPAPHEHNFVDGKCECGESDPTYKPEDPPSGDDVTEKKGYYISANNSLGTIYFDGTVTGGRFNGTTDKSMAALVYVESTSDGLLLYVEKSGVKSYIVMEDTSTGGSFTENAAYASVFAWNSAKQTFAVANEANNRGFGTDPAKSYSNFSTYDLSGSYSWGAFAASDGTTPPDNGDTTSKPSSGDSGTLGGGQTSTGGIVINGIPVPEYSGSGYYVVNGNNPFFTADDKKMTGYKYSSLDSLGRATGAFARLTVSLLPTDDRESISHIKPTGWVQATYSSLGIDSLYNRSHLIAHSLISDDVHLENFVTGTTYLNQKVMTTYEDMVRDLVKAGSDVLYRVTPYYVGDNLLCTGLLIEAFSIEDDGDDVCFCVFLYNVQPGVEIDYATGKSRIEKNDGDDSGSEGGSTVDPESGEVIFTFGDNGDASHADGSTIGTSKTFTENGSSLTLTDAYKVYSDARDAKGNSCLKLGISAEAGKFSFTVGAEVTKVYIKVAGYKSNSAKLTVNGTTHQISTHSNNGEYTVIEVDTSVQKTVSVSTANGGYRAMIDSITLSTK